MTTGGWQEAILGTWIVVMFIVWILAAATYRIQRIILWFDKMLGKKPSLYIETTLLQMEHEHHGHGKDAMDYRRVRRETRHFKGG
jgi:hypothetical protein